MSIATNQGKRRASARKYANRRTERAKVIRRFEANGGRCEACRCKPDRVEVDHLFGRGQQVADKYASLSVLCAALCPDCHLRHTNWTDAGMVATLRWNAVAEFAWAHHLPAPSGALIEKSEPILILRQMIDNLESEVPQ